ncbi:hypothetical protein BDZ91DRAFT_762436 [Kalaharituber pfeilii]|nr:hypothetical protein BDZ91DRAFT_762436 [Kalaharituber pfeilii]
MGMFDLWLRSRLGVHRQHSHYWALDEFSNPGETWDLGICRLVGGYFTRACVSEGSALTLGGSARWMSYGYGCIANIYSTRQLVQLSILLQLDRALQHGAVCSSQFAAYMCMLLCCAVLCKHVVSCQREGELKLNQESGINALYMNIAQKLHNAEGPAGWSTIRCYTEKYLPPNARMYMRWRELATKVQLEGRAVGEGQRVTQ